VFTFLTTGATSGPGTSWPSPSFTLNGSTAGGGNTRTFTLDAGTYTAKESTQLSWTLTGIGGSTDPNTPYNCKVEGSGGSTGVSTFNTIIDPSDPSFAKVTINLKIGDTVTCTYENTGNGATRTQGFWATHAKLADLAWKGLSGYGHSFPGVATVAGDTSICGRAVNSTLVVTSPPSNQLMGGFWSDIAKKSNGSKRAALDQSRMQLLQQLLAAELNASAFGSLPSGGAVKFGQWETAFCSGSNLNTAQQQAASFNSQGDNSTFTPGTAADSKLGRALADVKFWDAPAGP
jgi:hypothetical protein